MLTLGKNHLIFEGGGAQIRKKYRAFPRTDEKYRARQICKTNILQKFGKKYRAKSMTPDDCGKMNWRKKVVDIYKPSFTCFKAFHVFVKPR
jgi:hypothetical protein